jgi:hypothetical protein
MAKAENNVLKQCRRCSFADKHIAPEHHCNGDHRSVLRPGEKSETIRCLCSCNDYGKVQVKKGHRSLTRKMTDTSIRDFKRFWKGKKGR